jgi:putative NIF3 family GTP cyclohydrolase 1 type 2
MKLQALYALCVGKGIKEDPRRGDTPKKEMKDAAKEYKKLKGIEKAAFDKDRISNPYADSRILFGKGDEVIENIMVGIDIDVADLLLADRLKEKGKKIDLVISHHPSGRAYASLHKVMHLQSGVWEGYGFEKDIAAKIMKDRIDEVARSIAPRNHLRVVDAARLLKIPFMCMHTVADNCVAGYLQKLFNSKKPKKLKDVLRMLKGIPEYKRSLLSTGIGPFILSGDDKKDAGKIFVDMTGGTSGPDRLYARMHQSGVKTIVGMHVGDSGYKAAKSEFLNYVIAGHMASDTLGMNLMFDAVETKRNKFNFVECSGFKRYRRI